LTARRIVVGALFFRFAYGVAAEASVAFLG